VQNILGVPADQTGPGGSASGAGTGGAGPRLRGQPPRERVQQRHRRLDGQHPGQLQPRRGPDRPRAAGAHAPAVEPEVTTQNNQAAEIKQGVQIPIQTLANNTVSVQFKDAVLTLKVTPQITEAGTVILTLEVENNSPDYGRSVNGIPPINTQSGADAGAGEGRPDGGRGRHLPEHGDGDPGTRRPSSARSRSSATCSRGRARARRTPSFSCSSRRASSSPRG